MASFDQGGGCACGLYRKCECGQSSDTVSTYSAVSDSLPVDVLPVDNESVRVLRECIELQQRKSADYQSTASSVRQADYYPSGCLTIYEIMHAKMLRIKSLLETYQADPKSTPKNESIEDSAKDLVNYASFMVAYLRGGVDGQSIKKDILNRVI